MLKRIVIGPLLFGALFFFVQCETLDTREKDTETQGKILFKKMISESEDISHVYIKGLMKVSGVNNIPPAFINFEAYGNLKENNANFAISVLKKPLLKMSIQDENMLVINHTANQYVNVPIEDIDLSRLIGLNFNPAELSYLLLGKIPYTEDIQLMNFDYINDHYIMELTTKTSVFTISLTHDELIKEVEARNQYFETIYLDGMTYSENDDGIEIPETLKISNEDKTISLFFLIKSISYKEQSIDFLKDINLDEYTRLNSIEEIEIKVNN